MTAQVYTAHRTTFVLVTVPQSALKTTDGRIYANMSTKFTIIFHET